MQLIRTSVESSLKVICVLLETSYANFDSELDLLFVFHTRESADGVGQQPLTDTKNSTQR